MARLKIDYGIDLGTTNSAISRMEKGEPTIKKSDTLKDTMPSCVSITKKGSINVGDRAYNGMKQDKRKATKSWKKSDSNTYIEFKRTMGTDTIYKSSHLNRSFSSEELSAEVLKTLRSFITDENVGSIVITVPAKFTVNQKAATMRAAKLAGFKQCELLQEPIAAAMAYGLSSEQKNGYWLVFDFGGGTFDAALLKVEDGIMQVFDTEGDNYLGGKNLDYAIVDSIIIPYLQQKYSMDEILSDSLKKEVLRDAMKTYAEDAKNQLSFKSKEDIISDIGDLGNDDDGEEIELDLTVTQEQVFDVMRPLFQKSVDICLDLLKRNNLLGLQLDKIILVGGPTHSPLIRKMLKDQVSPNVDVSIDPMTAVATGAALYASTIDADESTLDNVVAETIKLKVGFESTSVEQVEYVTVQLDKKATGESCPDKVLVELVRGDNAWSSGKVEVDEVGNVIEANLIESKPNSFAIKVYNQEGTSLNCFPNEITIIQGSKVGAAPLPYFIGIGIYNDHKEKVVFKSLTGMEKNKPLPAIGVYNDGKTSSQLRPGISNDKLSIPIYEAEYDSIDKLASLYEYVADVIITGDDVEYLVPENSPVEVTLKADTSGMMTMDVYFPAQDFTISRALDSINKTQSIEDAANRIPRDLSEAQHNIDKLSEAGFDVSELQSQLDDVKEEHKNSSEKKAVLQHVKEVLRKIEDKDSETEWERVEKELRDEFNKLEEANKDLGDEKTNHLVNQLRSQVDKVIRSKDVRLAYKLKEDVHTLYFNITMVYQCIGAIEYWNRNFNSMRWSDSTRARQLINQALMKINNQPKTEELRPIVLSLFDLLPPEDKSKTANIGGILH